MPELVGGTHTPQANSNSAADRVKDVAERSVGRENGQHPAGVRPGAAAAPKVKVQCIGTHILKDEC